MIIEDALAITSQTLVGVSGKPPYQGGNCFNVRTKDKEYKIVNFVLENLEYLLTKGINWPIKISPLSEQVAIVHDERIPDTYYSKRFCEVCCPESLLPLPQILAYRRQEARGERVVGKGIVSYFFDKIPKIN